MSFTVLHISDLHRSPEDPISNDELLSTLEADRAHYTKEPVAIPAPDAIVVSGDIIQGVVVGEADYEARLSEQYEVALTFLRELTTRFVDGDISRVIIVPGNHDVDWNTARGAMEPVPEVEYPEQLSPEYVTPRSDYRWNWGDRTLYRIVDRDLYGRRFHAYERFRSEFYGTAGENTSGEPSHYTLHELFDGRIGVVAFNSCEGNDCFSFQGSIAEEALARAHLDLVDKASQHDLLAGVWHHSVDGPPDRSDYMDVNTVYRLTGKGFRVGFHGHQHRAQASHRYIQLPGTERFALISAGSLCAGSRQLPTGVNRQYNLVELSDSLEEAKVHVREMAVSTVFGPAMRVDMGGKSFVGLKWNLSTGFEKTVRARIDADVMTAETILQGGDPKTAAEILKHTDWPVGSYGRDLLLTALDDGKDWSGIVAHFQPPATVQELTTVVKSLVELRNHEEADWLLDRLGPDLSMQAAAQRDLKAWISARKRSQS